MNHITGEFFREFSRSIFWGGSKAGAVIKMVIWISTFFFAVTDTTLVTFGWLAFAVVTAIIITSASVLAWERCHLVIFHVNDVIVPDQKSETYLLEIANKGIGQSTSARVVVDRIIQDASAGQERKDLLNNRVQVCWAGHEKNDPAIISRSLPGQAIVFVKEYKDNCFQLFLAGRTDHILLINLHAPEWPKIWVHLVVIDDKATTADKWFVLTKTNDAIKMTCTCIADTPDFVKKN